MSESQTFWPVDCEQGAPDLFVCMECLNEVFQSKVPIQGCPGCGGVSTFEPFTLHAIQEWGTEELINKARAAADVGMVSGSDHGAPSVANENPLPT